MLEVHHWDPSGDSAAVLICLKEKGVAFESRYVDVLQCEQFSPSHLKLAPYGALPVLVHDGQVLAEPRLLNEYLVEAFPGPRLAPADAMGWYDVQAWSRFVDANLIGAVDLIGWNRVMLPAMSAGQRDDFERLRAEKAVEEPKAGWAAVVRDAESMENRIDNATGKVREAIERIEKILAKSQWLVGDSFSIADIGVFAQAMTLPRLLPDIVNAQATPRLLEWLARIGERPAVREALAMRRCTLAEDVYMPC
jgi:glutathione S-transferase